MVYIEEIDIREEKDFCGKLKYWIFKLFKFVKKEENNGKIKYKICKYKNRAKIISKIIKEINERRVVLDNELLKDHSVKNMFYSNKIDIVEGKELFRYLIIDSLKLIENIYRKNINNMEISVLANDIDSLDKINIVEIAKMSKRMNIITNHIDKFKKIEEDLFEEYGILINIANNKKKSLKSSDIIVNFDMPEEIINKYNVNPKSIFINISENINIKNKRFCGINIIDYNIEWDNEYDEIFADYEKFSKNNLYESLLKNNTYVHNINKIKEDNIRIKEFIGIRGKISKEEFKKL